MEFTASLESSGETTGRSLVLFDDDAGAGLQALQESIGADVVAATGPESAPAPGGGVVFETLGVAVVDLPPEQLTGALAADGVLAVEAERIVYAIEASAPPATENGHSSMDVRATAVDESRATWGLQATQVIHACPGGRGIRVAVLDTGFDLEHPDFAGRSITTESFIPGEAVQDGHGHGTHCIGTALGARCPEVRPRYGVAHEAEIFAGKVLSNAGSGSDTGILAGIEWAIKHECAVVSMSLGAATRPGQKHSQVYEKVAQRALSLGTLIVAAAGNESRRPGTINPVGHPANCPSIMAVAALDQNLEVAFFSTRGINPDGGEINIAGPGVDVYSTWPMPDRYNTISGTSMATPHVAGIAALYAQADSSARGQGLWDALVDNALALPLDADDVGAGLVQGP